MMIPTTLQQHFDFMMDNEPLPQFKVVEGNMEREFDTFSDLAQWLLEGSKQVCILPDEDEGGEVHDQ